MGQRVPYRSPYQVQSNQDLPFDPAMPTDDPNEASLRDVVMQAHQGMQDAGDAQAQAQQPPSGLSGLPQNPIFQLAVPTALTALSAIFPRHMAIAGPTGMAGYRTLEDQSMMAGQQQRTAASDVLKQRQGDFNKQRFRYAVAHSGLDPLQQQSLMAQADVDLPKASAALDQYTQGQVKKNAYDTSVKNFDPNTLQPDEERSFDDGMGNKTVYKKPGEKIDPYAVALAAARKRAQESGQPLDEGKFSRDWEDKNKKMTGEDYYISSAIAHRKPGESEIDAGAHAAQVFKTIGQENDLRNKEKIASDYVDAANEMGGPWPILSARTSVTPEMQMVFTVAHKKGIDVPAAMESQLAKLQTIKVLDSPHRQDQIAMAKNVERQLQNAEDAYEAWAPYASSLKIANVANLKLRAQHDDPGGIAAQNLLTAMAETSRGVGTMVQRGASITDDAAQAAATMIAPEFPIGNFKGAINVTRNQTRQWLFVLKHPDMMNSAGETIGKNEDEPPPTIGEPGGMAEPPRKNTPAGGADLSALTPEQQKRVKEIQAMPIGANAKKALARKEGLAR